MKKLSLNAEELRVDSFHTSEVPEYRGTVEANMISRGANTCYCTSRDIGCWCTEAC